MKLVHKSLTAFTAAAFVLLISASPPTLAQTSNKAPEYLRFYDPSKGFKPAQTNLTQIFLQVAGSLEHSGSPEAYIRYIQAEQARISQKFEVATNKPNRRGLPAHMTSEYLGKLIRNWNTLSPRLGLDALAKETGRCAREGIRGTRDTGTLAVSIFNEHQERVALAMKSADGASGSEFAVLREKLTKELEFDKEEITMVGYETTRRDAVSYALVMEGAFSRTFDKVDKALPSAQAEQVKTLVKSMFLDLAELAQAELELGLLNFALDS